MKQLFAVALLALFAIISCKKKESPAPPAGTYPLNQLTGIKYKMRYDSIGYSNTKYVTWKFTGTNPITATSVSDSVNFGYTTMYFTSQLATKLVYSNDTFNFRNGMTATISYNSDNVPDTLFLDARPGMWFAGPVANHRALVFEYKDSKISKVTYVSSSGFAYKDTLKWATPDRCYYYSYAGRNISQVTIETMPNTPYSDLTTISYTTSSMKNNLAKAFPQYLLLEFIASMKGSSEFPERLPFYLSEDVITSICGGSIPATFSYITDSKGRITQMISPKNYTFDTTFYYY